MMSLSATKFTSAYLGLFAILTIGLAQDIANDSQLKSINVQNRGSPFLTKIEYIRRRRASSSEVTSSCLTPPQPVNGHYKLDQNKISEGTAVEPGSQLIYRCNRGYRAKGNTEVYCRSRGRWSTIPECIEIKCDSLNSVSTMVSCTRFRKWVNCDSSVLPETRAEVACRRGYKKDTDFITTRRGVVNCNINGKWEPEPIRCVPVCGIAITHQQPFILGGTQAKIGDFPWHASIFIQTKSSTGNKKVFLCGATIIQTNLLLTAAHCVYNERTKTIEDPEKFFVITGNIFRDYDSSLHDTEIVRKAKVKKVYMSCNFYGLTGNYASDIALLELQQPFEFSGILIPACLDDSGYSEQFLEPGAFGTVAGFGRTKTGMSSGILQTITVPYISYTQCKASNNGAQNEAFISRDKFCAGYNNGSAVCNGDSGGGLVFKKADLWYVMGIVSVGLGANVDDAESTCDKYSYTLYTKVSHYMTWIQDVLFYLESKQPYPSCSRDLQTSMATSAIPTTTSRPTKTTISPSTFLISSPNSCLAPPQPLNGERKLHQIYCEGDIDCNVSEGTELELGSQLVYRCDPRFAAEGPAAVNCMANGKWTTIPTCIGPCSLTNGSPGVCILLKNCQSALEELKAGKSPDKLCGFSGVEPIVCCPKSSPVLTTTSLPVNTEGSFHDETGVISKQKCMEYSQHLDPWLCLQSAVDIEQPVNVSRTTGKSKAKSMEFPHMVAIGFDSDADTISWNCGGTLISEIFVMTTVTCSTSKALGNATWVRLGDLNLVRSDDGATPVDRRITERIPHPDYKHPVQYHNIALLRLQSPVSFSGWIRPACLHTTLTVGIQEAIATGWGRVEWLDEKASDDLMKVTLPLIDRQTCNDRWTSGVRDSRLPDGIVNDWIICAGGAGRDTCKGDNGGPLMIHSGDSMTKRCMYDVIGITSLGRACGTGFPGVYIRIYHHIPWIESVVWKQG